MILFIFILNKTFILIKNRNEKLSACYNCERKKENIEIVGFINEQDIYSALKFCELHPETCQI